MAENKIKYGIKNCYYAVATIASNGTATYGTPAPLAGAVSISLSAEGETSPFYADNIVYYTAISNNGYSGDLELALVPDDFLKDCLGYIVDSDGAYVEDANAAPGHFALTFEFAGDAKSKRTVLYNCVATRPEVSSETKGESIEPNTETISITATSIYNSSLSKDVVKASVTETQTTAYAAWNTTIHQSTGT